MARSLIDGRMLARLGRFFDATCTIQAAAITRGASGAQIKTWADVEDHVHIPCAIAPAVRDTPNQAEVRGYERSYTEHEFQATLRGYYPAITSAHRALIREIAYDVTSVEHDSHARTTRLRLRKVTL